MFDGNPFLGAEVVRVEQDGGIATVVIDRPNHHNALNKPVWLGLTAAFRRLGVDDGVRCIVLRGAGHEAFSPGADITEFEETRCDPAGAKEYGELIDDTVAALDDCPHPMVALIEGNCVGGGLLLAAKCDIRICGEGSRFGVPINRLGLTLGYPEIAAVIGLVGRAVTLEMLLEGRVFGAAEAKDKGLVNRVVPDGDVALTAYASARRIAEGAPLVNRWHKKFAHRLVDARPLSEEERDEAYACFATENFKTGFHTFLNKTKPAFQGR